MAPDEVQAWGEVMVVVGGGVRIRLVGAGSLPPSASCSSHVQCQALIQWALPPSFLFCPILLYPGLGARGFVVTVQKDFKQNPNPLFVCQFSKALSKRNTWTVCWVWYHLSCGWQFLYPVSLESHWKMLEGWVAGAHRTAEAGLAFIPQAGQPGRTGGAE